MYTYMYVYMQRINTFTLHMASAPLNVLLAVDAMVGIGLIVNLLVGVREA